jgi:hypothetical protein
MHADRSFIWAMLPFTFLFLLISLQGEDSRSKIPIPTTIIEETGVSDLGKHVHLQVLPAQASALGHVFDSGLRVRKLNTAPQSTDSHQMSVLRL